MAGVRIAIAGTLCALGWAVPAWAQSDAAARCAALTGAMPEVEHADVFAAAAGLPQHCLVRGTLDRRTGQGGRAFGIGFELRMPLEWNGRFLFQGGAGLDGQVAPAIGPIPNSSRPPALARGFAVASTDSGHRGPIVDASFASDQQARIDYGYNALDKVTAAAKALIARYYGRAPRFSYMVGCSNGGRQAMTVTQRLPLLFDGVVAGDPSMRFSGIALDELWNLRVLARAAPKDAQGRPIISRVFSDPDLKLVRAAVLKRCDKRDGLADGMINDWRGCDFDPVELKCKRAKTATCLTTAQVTALRDLHRGPRTRDGQSIYGPFNYDTGIASSAWRGMRLGKSETGVPDSADAILGLGQLRYFQLTPPDPNFDPWGPVDFDRLLERIRSTAALADADSPFLTTFANRGKLIVYNGLSDQGIASRVVTGWYDRMIEATGAPARDTVRVFLVPGMLHCGGGEATDRFEMLDAIMAWVEQGQAPDRILATGRGEHAPTRPLCAYPTIARFKGGDENDAASFACAE